MSQDTTKVESQSLHQPAELTAAEMLQELHAKIDLSLKHPGEGYSPKALHDEALEFCRQQGREAALISDRIRQVEALEEDADEEEPDPEEEIRKRSTQRDLFLMDRMKDADELLCVYANNSGPRKLPGVAEALYDAAGHLIQSDDATHQRLGYVFALDAFLAVPGALEQAVRTLRQALVDSDPDLALLGRAPVAPVAQAHPAPASHEIDAVQFHLRPTGELLIERTGAELISLTPRQSYAVLAFLRLPGVAATIEHAEERDQVEGYERYQVDVAAGR